MPSSQNRRRIEIPAELYQQLADRAAQDRTTVAALAAHILQHGLTEPDTQSALASIQHQLSILHERIESLHAIGSRVAPLRAVGGPMSIRPEILERARQELIDDLRRDRRRADDAGERT